MRTLNLFSKANIVILEPWESLYLVERIDKNKYLYVDTETIGLYGIVRLAQFYQSGWSKVILIEYPQATHLAAIFKQSHCVFHVASYDISTVQDHCGINGSKGDCTPLDFEDTFLLARLKYAEKKSFTLEDCIEYVLGYNPYKQCGLDKKQEQKSLWAVKNLTDNQLLYSVLDVYYLSVVLEDCRDFIETNSYKLDKNFLILCLQFQKNGMYVNPTKCKDLIASNERKIEDLDLPINSNSYKQVRAYCESTGSDEKALSYLKLDGNENAGRVLAVRGLRSLNSHLKKYLVEDFYIKGKFSPSARSGRSTCKDQNLQQIPRKVRGIFTAPEGYIYLYSDYSQLELRCICAILGDTVMYNLFRRGEDVHTYTAKKVFHCINPTPEERQIAKTLNFNLLYAGSAAMLQTILVKSGVTIDLHTCRQHKKAWLFTWSKITKWQNKCYADWESGKLSCTPLGRFYSGKLYTDQCNIMVQGMGAEVAKLAAIYVDNDLKKAYPNRYSKWFCNFLHDGYLYCVPDDPDLYKDISSIIAKNMSKAWTVISTRCSIRDVPMPITVLAGYNWGSLEDKEYVYKLEL